MRRCVVDTLILVINPGSTSTKLALYSGETLLSSEAIVHDRSELATYERVSDQAPMRQRAVREWLDRHLESLRAGGADARLSAVAARGGLVRPLPSGTYRVDPKMLEDLQNPVREHASNLAPLIGQELARYHGVEAFCVDPVCVDEMDDIARFTGLPGLRRPSLSHALSMKATARRAAQELGRPYPDLYMVVAHLGGGISISAHRQGRMVDVSNSMDDGPFSPERAGRLPLGELLRLAEAVPVDQLRRRIWGGGGLVAYLGTNDAREVDALIDGGDEGAEAAYRAMAYGVAKEMGAMAAALGRNPDALVLTGGLAWSGRFVQWVTHRISFLGPVLVYPGEDEMGALARGVLRVLRGEEPAREYGKSILGVTEAGDRNGR